MLMLVCTCSADDAFELLRTISQHSNVKLVHTAAIIVAAVSHWEPLRPPVAQKVADVLHHARRLVLDLPVGSQN